MTDATGPISAKGAARIRAQCAALCWRAGDAGVEVLLITSRETARWVVPKGWPVRGLTAPEAAAREAFEEAGVEGTVDARSLGCFGYDKVLGRRTAGGRQVPCIVTLFPLRVEALSDAFPEAGQRRRAWFAPAEAARLVDEPELRRLIAGFTPGSDGNGAAPVS